VSLADLLALAGDAATPRAPLGARTTSRVGGVARLLVEISSPAELARLAPALTGLEVPLLVVGLGSNLLVADGEYDGVVVALGAGFAELSWREDGDTIIVSAGAALALPVAARRLSDAGVVGFEWAVGIPGSFGGAVVMNAGGHGGQMADVVAAAEVFSFQTGTSRCRPASDLAFRYRASALTAHDLVTSVTLTLTRGDAEAAKVAVREIVAWRRTNQPGGANAGSVFMNPQTGSAGQLIEAAGLKGARVGGAHVSDKHANFILVDAGASAADVVALMVLVRDRVRTTSGVNLESELRLVGFAGQWP
jgi:UDP-N-acetylmuramate dehydrogenase